MVLLPPELHVCLEVIALLDLMEGQFERALRLFSAASALESKLGQGDSLGMQARVDEALETIQRKLGEESFAQVWETGQSMSSESIMAYALETPSERTLRLAIR